MTTPCPERRTLLGVPLPEDHEPVVMMDMDGVLSDFILGFTRVAETLFGTRAYSTGEQQVWDRFNGITPAQVAEVWRAISGSPDFWLNLEPLATPREFRALAALAGRAHVYYVTYRVGVQPRQQTVRWLRRHGIPDPVVILSARKGEMARALGATHAVEDKAGNAVFMAYHSPETRVSLIDRPYNRFDPEVLGARVRRITTLTEFLEDL